MLPQTTATGFPHRFNDHGVPIFRHNRMCIGQTDQQKKYVDDSNCKARSNNKKFVTVLNGKLSHYSTFNNMSTKLKTCQNCLFRRKKISPNPDRALCAETSYVVHGPVLDEGLKIPVDNCPSCLDLDQKIQTFKGCRVTERNNATAHGS